MGEGGTGIWIFGYGSLMWNPGFPHEEARPALLRGYHRDFCIYSYDYRGTPERPGLVLGLARGGSCRGMAYRVSRADRRAALDYLHEREMASYTYEPRRLPVAVGRERVLSRIYVADHTHPNYAGRLTIEETARIIARARGRRGPNRDYLVNTLCHLAARGSVDGRLRRLAALVESLV